jgi:NADH-quinone oxidoreductase subunit L
MVSLARATGALDLLWLIPALPFAGSMLIFAFGKRMRDSGLLASIAVGASFVVTLIVLIELLGRSSADRVAIQHVWSWIHVGAFRADVNLRADPLSIVMAMVVTGVGLLIHVYAIGYMHGDPKYNRFFAQLNLFVFFMLLLVLADNYLLLYVGWEGVGLCSYLLIGHWSERPAAANAAKKAFIVTRVGDAAFLVGIAFIATAFHSLNFGTVFHTAGHALQNCRGTPAQCGPGSFIPMNTITVIALLLLCGAAGKSAQLPLQTWLPDAMEGPTPVSALIHAATMVTAGVYLVVRSHVFFELSSLASTVVLIGGLVTALYAATSALGQDDYKRVLAYSTMSQIGYMFFACGLHAYSLAIVLLVAHAFYKALLFMSAGNVMHALDGETDLKVMGGLRRALPLTFGLFVVGWLSIAGIPPLSGFFAKDQILAAASQSAHYLAWAVGLLAAFFSALYISRLAFLAYFGRYRGERDAHEAPRIMTIPMSLLAVATAVGGILGISAVNGVIPKFLAPVVGVTPEAHRGPSTLVLALISVAVALVGIGLAWFVYRSGQVDWVALRDRFRLVRRTFETGWWFDTVYGAVLVAPGKAVSAFMAYVVDQRVIDGAVNWVGRGFTSLASVGRRVQTGLVRTYALAVLFGAVALLWYLVARS